MVRPGEEQPEEQHPGRAPGAPGKSLSGQAWKRETFLIQGAAGLAGMKSRRGTARIPGNRPRLFFQMTTPDQREQLRQEELCNRWAGVGCEVAQLVRNCPAPLAVRVRELERLADVAAFHLARLRLQLPAPDPLPMPPDPEKRANGHRSAWQLTG